MSTHNICFRGEIRKNINTFGLKKSALTSAMLFIINGSVAVPTFNHQYLEVPQHLLGVSDCWTSLSVSTYYIFFFSSTKKH